MTANRYSSERANGVENEMVAIDSEGWGGGERKTYRVIFALGGSFGASDFQHLLQGVLWQRCHRGALSIPLASWEELFLHFRFVFVW